MANKFANIKTEMGICSVGSDLSYGVHITGVITSGDKSAFSVLATTTDDTKDIIVDTYIHVSKGRESIVEISDIANYKWFFDKESTPKIPNNISDEVRKLILKDINKTKAIYKNAGKFSPINGLSDEDSKVAIDTLEAMGIFNTIKEYVKQLDSEIDKEIKASAGVDLDTFVERYAFKEHVLLSGKRGVGKTYTVDKYLKDHGCSIEQINGHAGIESTDLLGYSIRHIDGSFCWMDGPLTAAFRSAQTTPTALFIDELLRIPAKELNILIGALTPNSSNEFVLRTNRIIDIVGGIGKSETIKVPCENFWAVATTNIGSDYDVEDMDLALNDRFITHEVISGDDAVAIIIESNNPNDIQQSSLDKLMNLYKAINALVATQELTYTMNVRHLTKVLKNVTDPKEFKSYLFDLAPNVCSRTTEGNLNEVELKIFKDTIKSIF